ncbi:MAG TPA: hypothetical protein PK447_06370 [Ignavibacteria bacterium]|nr:hypothetical protein [Ignavibacteria bacterium]
MFFTKFFNDKTIVLVCKGYNEEFDMFTGLYWDDDKDLDLSDLNYSDFQLWCFN